MRRGHTYKKSIFAFLAAALITMTTYGTLAAPHQQTTLVQEPYLETTDTTTYERFNVIPKMAAQSPSAITVSDSNPYYALIATPLALFYNELGEQ
ncbi:MAG: hypothetical protein KKG04_08440, partial [Candidatus Thermoplasmatota archaeon]|nr:hypothetical protein [Candidatus Thermoplasmatota archaeon]